MLRPSRRQRLGKMLIDLVELHGSLKQSKYYTETLRSEFEQIHTMLEEWKTDISGSFSKPSLTSEALKGMLQGAASDCKAAVHFIKVNKAVLNQGKKKAKDEDDAASVMTKQSKRSKK